MIIIPSLLDFYVYGIPFFQVMMIFFGFKWKREYFYKKARIQFIMENYYS